METALCIGMKLLLDENISPSISADLWQIDINAVSVRDRVKLGATDTEIVRLATAEDLIIITANAAGFTALCSFEEIHPGLITIENGTREQQLYMIQTACKYIFRKALVTKQQPSNYMINRVVEANRAGKCSDHSLPNQ